MHSMEIRLKCSRHSLEPSTRMWWLWMTQENRWNYCKKLRAICTEMPSRRETNCSLLTCMSLAHALFLSSIREAPRWSSFRRWLFRVMAFTQGTRESREKLWSNQEWSQACNWSSLVRAIARQTSWLGIWLSLCRRSLMTRLEEWEMTWSTDTRCRWQMLLPIQ